MKTGDTVKVMRRNGYSGITSCFYQDRQGNPLPFEIIRETPTLLILRNPAQNIMKFYKSSGRCVGGDRFVFAFITPFAS